MHAILTFAADILEGNHEYPRALEILEEYLERSWGKREQYRAYEMIARLYTTKNDFANSIVYLERQLPIAKKTKNVESEAAALRGLAHNYGRMGDYGNAMAYLEQALVIRSELGGDGIGLTYSAMGNVLVAQEGREKEGILMFQKCVGLFEQGNIALMPLFLKLGQAHEHPGLERCYRIYGERLIYY